jgi:hypothetical protein
MNKEEQKIKKLLKKLNQEKKNTVYLKNRSEDVDAFLEDIIKVCYEHNMSLSHEDSQGGFLVDGLNESNFSWLYAASDKRF